MQKYTHLICLVKCILSQSHGNSTPGRGFSINNYILEVHGNLTSEKALESLRFVKDDVCRVGEVANFPISRKLISSVKNAHSQYVADLEMQK